MKLSLHEYQHTMSLEIKCNIDPMKLQHEIMHWERVFQTLFHSLLAQTLFRSLLTYVAILVTSTWNSPLGLALTLSIIFRTVPNRYCQFYTCSVAQLVELRDAGVPAIYVAKATSVIHTDCGFIAQSLLLNLTMLLEPKIYFWKWEFYPWPKNMYEFWLLDSEVWCCKVSSAWLACCC